LPPRLVQLQLRSQLQLQLSHKAQLRSRFLTTEHKRLHLRSTTRNLRTLSPPLRRNLSSQVQASSEARTRVGKIEKLLQLSSQVTSMLRHIQMHSHGTVSSPSSPTRPESNGVETSPQRTRTSGRMLLSQKQRRLTTLSSQNHSARVKLQLKVTKNSLQLRARRRKRSNSSPRRRPTMAGKR